MYRIIGITIIACIHCSVMQAQQSFIEKFNLPQVDCELKFLTELKKATIVVPNDSSVVWEKAKEFKKNFMRAEAEVVIKTESNLLKSDFDGNIFIMGPIADYSHWDRFDIPIKKLKRGFKIGKFSFKEQSYGFSYVSPPDAYPIRFAISGNSLKAYEQAHDMPTHGGFEYIVLQNAIPKLIGNGLHIVDLHALLKSLYTYVESKFAIFMISKNLSLEEREKVNNEAIEQYNKHIEIFVEKMKLSLPEKKVKAHIHATQEEIKYFSGLFVALCGSTLHGFVTGDEIHNWMWKESTIVHETIHLLFDPQVNNKSATFLNEGVPTWYEHIMCAEEKERGFLKAIEFIDYDLTSVISGEEFFYQEDDKYYLISGIFTGYMIETYGVDKFKELYRHERRDILYGFEKTYGKPLSEVLEEYKKWLLSKNTNHKLNQ